MRWEKEEYRKYGIFFEILTICKNPARLDQIEKSINANCELIENWLRELEVKGLINKKGVHWLTTPQGKSYIKLFEKIKNLID